MKYFIKILIAILLTAVVFAQSFLQNSEMSKFYKFYYSDGEKTQNQLDSDTEFYKYLIWLKNNPYGQINQQFNNNCNNGCTQTQNGVNYTVNSNNSDCNTGNPCSNGNIHISIDIPCNSCQPCQPVSQPQPVRYYPPAERSFQLPELPAELPSAAIPEASTPGVEEEKYPWKMAVSLEGAVTEPWGATGQNNGIGYSIQAKVMIRPYYWNQKKTLKPWRYGMYIDKSHFTGKTKNTTNWQPPDSTYADRYGIAFFARYDITELYLKDPIIGVYINPEVRMGTINYNNPHPEEYAPTDTPVPTGIYNTFGLGYEFGAYYYITDVLAMELKVYQTYDYNKIFNVLGQLGVMQRAHMENGARLSLLYRF